MISQLSTAVALGDHSAAAPGGSGDERTRTKRQAWLLTSAALAGAILCAVLWLTSRQEFAQLSARTVRCSALALDAQTIAAIRTKPRQAAETTLTRADLLERVAGAMRAANIKNEMLISSFPQPPRPLRGGQLAEVASRLVFEPISLRQLVDFGAALQGEDGPLHVTGLHLRAGPQHTTWHVDATVSYLLVVADAPRLSG